MTIAFSACYSDGSHFASQHFKERSKASSFARKMSRQYSNKAYVAKCFGEWIGTTFSESIVINVAVYNNGKKE